MNQGRELTHILSALILCYILIISLILFFPLPFPFLIFPIAFLGFKESNYIRQETACELFKFMLWNIAFVCRHKASQH